MGVCLCRCEVELRTRKAVGRRANGKGGEVGRQTEENDEKDMYMFDQNNEFN